MPREIDPWELEFINEKGIIHKLFDRFKNFLIFVFTREWESLDVDTKRYKSKGFTGVDEYKTMSKRNKNKFLKDYDYKKKR